MISRHGVSDGFAYRDDIVGIRAVEVGDANAGWKGFLAFKRLVEALAELRLNTECLEYKNAHAHKTLLGRIIALINRIV